MRLAHLHLVECWATALFRSWFYRLIGAEGLVELALRFCRTHAMCERLLLVFMVRVRMRIGAMRVLGVRYILASIRIARANGAMSRRARAPYVGSRGMACWHWGSWHVRSIRGMNGAFTTSSVLIGAASSRCRERLGEGWIVRESLRTRGSRMRRALTRLIRHRTLRVHLRG